eukprot:1154089-Pelagomonas_calceolata.AAC.1
MNSVGVLAGPGWVGTSGGVGVSVSPTVLGKVVKFGIGGQHPCDASGCSNLLGIRNNKTLKGLQGLQGKKGLSQDI